MKEIINIFPCRLREKINDNDFKNITDLRISARKPMIYMSPEEEFITEFEITYDDIKTILENATENSLYSYTEDIKEGFITLPGGHRMGISGRAVNEKNILASIRDINYINIRIAREIKGAATDIIPCVFENGKLLNTLIISPPGLGKTTLLRDMARILGDMKNMRPSVIDSRFEIGAQYKGIPTMDIGLRSFLLSGYKKSDGFSHSVRCLSSNVILCDEIAKEDFCYIDFALKSGVSVIATAHGSSAEDVARKFDISMFSKFIVLKKRGGKAEIL